MNSKLNPLLMVWPKGAVATSAWLQAHGVYRQLARRYVNSGWIQPLGHGAFIRAGDSVDWFGRVYALQTQLKLSVYAGGITALSLKGLGQYLPLGTGAEVSLFSEALERLPVWFTRHAWGVTIRHHTPKLFESSPSDSFTEVKRGELSIRTSVPERAIMEVLHRASSPTRIEQAVELMSGLTTLRPQLLQALLEQCRSIKVKRLFLWAAESAGHEWFGRLSVDRVNLGQGKRSLCRGGRFDPKYRITVPHPEEPAHV